MHRKKKKIFNISNNTFTYGLQFKKDAFRNLTSQLFSGGVICYIYWQENNVS